MTEISDNYRKNFVATRFYETLYKTRTDTKNILVEERTNADGETIVFTVINQRPIHLGSVQEIAALEDCLSISIPHELPLLWNKEVKRGKLTETIFRNPESSTIAPYLTRLQLNVEGQIYTTEDCDTFSEAVGELRDLMGNIVSWHFMTCYHCSYAHLAFLSPMNDRYDLRCFRDVVEELHGEVKEKGKFASLAARYAGSYFVDGFHRCAAWQPINEQQNPT